MNGVAPAAASLWVQTGVNTAADGFALSTVESPPITGAVAVRGCVRAGELQSSAGPAPEMDDAPTSARRTCTVVPACQSMQPFLCSWDPQLSAPWNTRLNGSLVTNKWLQLPAPMRPRLWRPPLLPPARTASGTRARHHLGRRKTKTRRRPRVVVTPYNHQHGAALLRHDRRVGHIHEACARGSTSPPAPSIRTRRGWRRTRAQSGSAHRRPPLRRAPPARADARADAPGARGSGPG